jgi:hypothetical protein
VPLPEHFSWLWTLAETMAGETGSDPRYVFDPCGLLLERRPAPWTYFCSPRNALTFASTGGDGVHFGILRLAEHVHEHAPIVMTVPMSDIRNVVLAESFEEFLGLGCHVGWFMLEQLAYDPIWTVKHFSNSNQVSPECHAVLKRIRAELRLDYVPLDLARITQLNDRYLPLLRLSDNAQ